MMTELGFPNKNRVAILAELDKEKRKLLLQNQSSTNNPGASIALSRPNVNKDFRDRAEQQHIAAQQKAALQHAHAHSSGYFITQDSAFGNLILPVIPRLDAE
ncbi:SOSS complex subunit C [Pseudophryne corroboree]|uniref:SOSS complex subunit C n=1 Tax=Pseudophryne corroboree TaxID=495146 RepID=UPI0030813408